MQYAHFELQPIETCTQALKRRSRCIGQRRGERLVRAEPAARHGDSRPPSIHSPRCGIEPGPERDVDERIALEDPLALRLRVAAADRDDEIGLAALARRRVAEVRGELRVRLLADRARVEDEHVRALRRRRLAEAERLEHALDALRVVSVHLAAERGDEIASGHVMSSRCER